MMKKGKLLYEGKAKSLYECDDQQSLIMHFRDDISAFNAEKLAKLSKKGEVNNRVNAFVMEKLAQAKIATHHIKILNPTESLVKRLEMLPIECVVRNIAAGSICKRLGVESGKVFETPMFEFFYKDDALGDPLINDSHIATFEWATEEEVAEMKRLSLEVNTVLKALFLNADMILVDYKLEFGRYEGQLLLGDEFTSDGCRIWDVNTKKALDKDRFRQDMGDVVEAYQEVANRLGVEA